MFTLNPYFFSLHFRCQGSEPGLKEESRDLPGANSTVSWEPNQNHVPCVSPKVFETSASSCTSQGHQLGGDATHGGTEGPGQCQNGQSLWGITGLRVTGFQFSEHCCLIFVVVNLPFSILEVLILLFHSKLKTSMICKPLPYMHSFVLCLCTVFLCCKLSCPVKGSFFVYWKLADYIFAVRVYVYVYVATLWIDIGLVGANWSHPDIRPSGIRHRCHGEIRAQA